MCDRCTLIDYPIGDVIWLPCGGPKWRYGNPGYRHQPKQRPDDAHDQAILAAICAGITRPEHQPPQTGFEGIDT